MKRVEGTSSTRERILQSAIELFGDKGYHATSIQEICDQAGVSKGALFHYFSNKNEILFEIHEFVIDRWISQCEAISNNHGLTSSQKIYQLIETVLNNLVDYRQQGKILFKEITTLEGETGEIIKARRDYVEEIVGSIIEEGMQSGEFKSNQDSRIMTKLFFGTINWTHYWYRPEGDLTIGQMANSICSFVLEGLGGYHMGNDSRI